MLNGDGIENGKKTTSTTTTTTTIGLISKKITLHVQHTFLYISLPLLLHNYNVKLSSYIFHGGNVVCSPPKNCCLCSCSLSFSLPLIFNLLAANISHFLHRF